MPNNVTNESCFFQYARLFDFVNTVQMRIGKDFLSLYDVIPTLCNDNKPEMSLRDYRKSKVEKKVREFQYSTERKKSFEISTAAQYYK